MTKYFIYRKYDADNYTYVGIELTVLGFIDDYAIISGDNISNGMRVYDKFNWQ